MKTTITKSSHGWTAETKVELGLTRRDDYKKVDMPLILVIDTMKSIGGKLYSRADVQAEYGNCIIMEVYGEFSKNLESNAERCTEKSVRAMHDRALACLPGLIEEAKAFYAAKETKTV